MKKIIDKLINHAINGVDTYSHNGSTWLIFTESKQWVIELTESKTLWYNYNFFKNLFNYTSMDVVENQSYITQWVEDNIINKVKDTILEQNITEGEVEGIIEMAVKENSFSFVRMKVDSYNVIKNGVKETNKSLRIDGSLVIEDTIQNGVIETNHVDVMKFFDNKMDDVIENGVKDTQLHKGIRPSAVEHTIENGVKKTGPIQHKYMVEDIIENGELKTSPRNLEQFGQGYSLWKTETVINEGVKEIKGDSSQNPMGKVSEVIKNGIKKSIAAGYEKPNSLVYLKSPDEIDEVLENGVKETKTPSNGDIVSFAEWMKENNSTSYPKLIDDVIENGIKETQPLPDQSGELIGYGNYYHDKEDRTKAFYNYLEETIKFGVKENLG
jgi:hypothetical protein